MCIRDRISCNDDEIGFEPYTYEEEEIVTLSHFANATDWPVRSVYRVSRNSYDVGTVPRCRRRGKIESGA